MIWMICIFSLFLCSCDQKPQESQYKEIVVQAATADPHIAAPAQQNSLAWVSPDGWREESGKDMRVASFYSAVDPNAIDCYIIILGGPAGGREANLQRWLGQLGLQASDENVNQLIASAQALKTKDDLEVKVFDFSILQAQGSPSDKSMAAAMIVMDQTTVFVKMTGSMAAVKANKDNYFKLLRSITQK